MKNRKMQLTTLHNLTQKMNVNDSDVDHFADKMTRGADLRDLAKTLGKHVTYEKAYVLAKAYAKEVMGESIEDIAPHLMDQRLRMLQKSRSLLDEQRNEKEKDRILEEVLEELSLIKMERMTALAG